MNRPEIIDFHAHIYPQKIAEKASRGVGEFYNIPMGHIGTAERLIQSGDEAGISRFVVQSVATTPHQVQSINAFIAETCEKSGGRLIGLGTIHPDVEDPMAEIDNIERLDLHGVKIHPDVQRFMMDDERMFPIYDRLQGRLPILIHCGDYRYPYSHPSRLARILDLFPKLTVVAAHFGGWSLWDLALEFLEHRRCYLDTSSSFEFLGHRRSKELIEFYGADRIVFGVDFPMWDHKPELETFFSMGFSEEENEKILSKNALMILGMN